jgi:site-specific DNA-cytosine methylase
VITAGEFAAGSGSFVRYANSVGIETKWVAEKVPALEAQAAAEAGQGVVRHGDILLVHPREVGEVFLLMGGPECQSFSNAGRRKGLGDLRARTFFWVLWCLAERQFPAAFIENVDALLRMEHGRVWKLLKAVAEGIGYCVSVRSDSPLHHGIPHDRQRAFIYMQRADLTQEWGMPAEVPLSATQHLPFVPLERFLLPPTDPEVVQAFEAFALVLLQLDLVGEFSEVIWQEDKSRRLPHCAWKCGQGRFGQRAFTNAVPAIKVNGELPAGPTQAIVQQTASGPAVRSLLKREVQQLFRAQHSDIDVAVDMDSDYALEAMGGGCQGDMFIYNLRRCIDHVRTINTFEPTDISQVLDPRVVRGTLDVL